MNFSYQIFLKQKIVKREGSRATDCTATSPWPSDREAVRIGPRQEGQAGSSASTSGCFAYLAPEAGLPAMPGAQAAGKGFVRLEGPAVLDAGRE